MSVLHQALLAAGLAAVAIPIIIHLLMRRRRRPVEWGAMRFVLEAYRRTRRRLVVQRWLLLALRCLLVAALGVAIARPLLGSAGAGAGAGSGRTVYIVLDNSIASQARDGRGAALERHVAAAVEVLRALGDGDRAALVLAAAPGQVPGTRFAGGPIVVPPSSNLRAVEEALSKARATDAPADFPGALRAVAAAMESGVDASSAANARAGAVPDTIVLISDWRLGSADLQTALPKLEGSPVMVATAPGTEAVDNIGVSRVSVLREVMISGQAALPQTATVELLRSGPSVERAGATRVALGWMDARGTAGAGPTGEVRWTPGQRSATVTMAIDAPDAAGGAGADASGTLGAGTSPTPPASGGTAGGSGGDAVLVATLSGDAVPGDDRWRLPLQTRPAIRVGLVSDDPGRARWGGGGGGGGAGDGFPAAQWVALALRPGPASRTGIELSDIDTAAIDASRLAGLDAAFVTTPQRVDDEGWARLAGFARAGGLLIVLPPGDQQVHAWTDAMVRSLGLDWTVSREPRTWAPDAPRPRLSAAGPSEPTADLLSAVRGELTDLAAAVTVDRLLVATAIGGSAVQLALEDGTPLVLSAPVGAVAAGGGAAPTTGGPRGLVVFVTAALSTSWTDLPAKPLIIPLVQELVRQGVSRARPGAWSPAGALATAPAQSTQLALIALGGGGGAGAEGSAEAVALLLDAAGRTGEPVRVAGAYRATDSRGGQRGIVAVNPDAAGARTDAQPRDAVEGWLGASAGKGSERAAVRWLEPATGPTGEGAGRGALAALSATSRDGSPTGPLLLLAVLALAGFELVAAWWASHGSSTSPSSAGGARA